MLVYLCLLSFLFLQIITSYWLWGSCPLIIGVAHVVNTCLSCFLLFQLIISCWFGVSCPFIHGLCRTTGTLHRVCVEPSSLWMVLVREMLKWVSPLLPTYLLACLGYKILDSGGCIPKCRSLFSSGDRFLWSAFRLFFLCPWGVSALCSLSLGQGARWFLDVVYHSQGDESPKRFLGSCWRYFSEAVSIKTSKDVFMGARWYTEEIYHSQGDESPRLFLGSCCRYFSEASSIKTSKDGCFPPASVARPSKIVVDVFEVRGQTAVVRHQHDVVSRCIYLVVFRLC